MTARELLSHDTPTPIAEWLHCEACQRVGVEFCEYLRAAE